MTKDDALRLALVALEKERPYLGAWPTLTVKAITAINEALAQPAQEPVAYLCGPDENGLFGLPTADKACNDCFPVYTAPPQRTWVEPTEGEWFKCWLILQAVDETEAEFDFADFLIIAQAVAANLKGKNT